MPIYEYVCQCGYFVNYYLTMSERDRIFECPVCGKKMDKLIGRGSVFNLKGKGFYKGGIQ